MLNFEFDTMDLVTPCSAQSLPQCLKLVAPLALT